MEPTDFPFIPYIEIYNNDYALFKKKEPNISITLLCPSRVTSRAM